MKPRAAHLGSRHPEPLLLRQASFFLYGLRGYDRRLHNLIGLQAPNSVLVFGNGPFQRRVLFGTLVCLLATVLHHMALLVLARPVDHWCRPPPGYEHVPLQEWRNLSLPRRADGGPDQCARYEPPLPPPEDYNRTEVPCEAWDYDLSQGGPTITSQWDLVCHRRRLMVGLMGTQLIGGAVAAPLAGLGADVLGRRPVVCTAGRGLRVFRPGHLPGAVTPRDSRTGFVTLALCAAAILSSLWLAMAARFTYSWAVVQASIMLPALLMAPATYWMEESPRWLTVTWKFAEAEQVVQRAARVNGLNLCELGPLFREVVNNFKSRQRSLPLTCTVWALVRSSHIRARTIIVCGCWFFAFNAVVILRPQTGLRDFTPSSAVVMYVTGPILVTHYLFMKTWGRRRLLSLLMALLSVLSIIMAVLTAASVAPTLLPTGIALVMICVLVVLCVYTIEVFPTVVRGAGLAGATLSGRLGALVAVVVRNLVRIDVVQSDVVHLVVVSLGALCFGLLALRLPETSVQRVTDTIQEAEEEELIRVESLFTIFIRTRSPHCPAKASSEGS
ncbi:hypothetical protein HPB48_012751 [Haemaphysalis longicornis]|uniref:Uncharacterized protein n=1 Tax=Haemaphysalis longicornis TaxID=44386 RepID=A0A9J6GEW0_HAELO|nr:hypothetical protein HPB48_012751 [Haemaphysalis longicornis]